MDNHLVNILIADDEEGIRISLEWILELERYTVVIASNGLEAIENIKKHPCDIAFL
ncbi:MAG: response regulator, partial [Endomicrobiales bacterium]